MKYKLILRYYESVGRFKGIEVSNPELVRIVPFPAPDPYCKDLIAIFEFIPVEGGESDEGNKREPK